MCEQKHLASLPSKSLKQKLLKLIYEIRTYFDIVSCLNECLRCYCDSLHPISVIEKDSHCLQKPCNKNHSPKYQSKFRKAYLSLTLQVPTHTYFDLSGEIPSFSSTILTQRLKITQMTTTKSEPLHCRPSSCLKGASKAPTSSIDVCPVL